MAEKRKLLVADDEEMIREAVASYLESQGYQVFRAENGEEALNILKREPISLVILDLMLPDLPGEEVCVRIRKQSRVPIIMLTAKNVEYDMIHGLDLGADDYITKPFNILELRRCTRQSCCRNNRSHRKEEEKDTRIHVRDLTMDTESRRVFLGDREVNLTAKEFDLLELILTNPGKVYSREQLLNLVWGFEYPGDVRTVDVHVRRLREKIETNPSDPHYVYTKWGVGYFYKN